ncbi:MAG: patatin-like phospholipase family protein, partial [Pseudomonadales bacterium]|nr:patatin-like phospholipase family protein [Pseudomonadales bacterium]
MSWVRRFIFPLIVWVFTISVLVPVTDSFASDVEATENEANGSELYPQQSHMLARPKVGLVLSGGGARGLAHIGIIRVLEEMHVPVDIVVGTSAGSAVAALYAMGLPVEVIEQRFHEMNWQRGFQDKLDRSGLSMRRKRDSLMHSVDVTLGFNQEGLRLKNALVQGQQLELILNDLTREAAYINDFDQLPRRYRAVAADLATGEAAVLGTGSIAQAIRASMSIPGVFPPVHLDGRLLVDGGVANNIPIDIARELGAEIIIAVDISMPLIPQEKLSGLFTIAEQITNFLTRKNMAQQLSLLSDQDILIVPDLEDFTSADFDRSDEIVEVGATAARNAAVQLKALKIGPLQWQAYQKNYVRMSSQAADIIHQINIINESYAADDFLRKRITQQIGESFDRDRLERDISEIYGLGYFETVTYTLKKVGERNVLEILAREKSWGPNFLQFDFRYEDDFDIDRRIDVGVSVNFADINALGAEWHSHIAIGSEPKVMTEFYQPLDTVDATFINVRAAFEKQLFNLFVDDDQLSEVELRRVYGAFTLGQELGNWGEIAAGLVLEDADLKGRIGVGLGLEQSLQHGILTASFTYDTLSEATVPRTGHYLSSRFESYQPDLGSDERFDLIKINGVLAFSHGKYTLNLRGKGQFASSGEVTVD